MKIFNVEHVACYVCHSLDDVKMIDFDLKDGGYPGNGTGQIALCKTCRKELKKILQESEE